MRKSLHIYQEFLAPTDLELLKKYCTRINSSAKGLHVRELGRHGKTQARLLLTRFAKTGGTLFVVKLDDSKIIHSEEKAIKKIKSFFPDALSGYDPEYNENRGVLAYKHFGTTRPADADKTLDLERIAYDRNYSNSKFVQVLKILYDEHCITAHEACEPKEHIFIKEYRWYLRNMAAKIRIESVLGTNSKRNQIDLMGTKIFNPLKALHKGFQQSVKFMAGPIHGDMHPTNVILDTHLTPYLIDFAWANRDGHVLKDFVLMENSLRFMLFPHHVNWQLHKKFNTDLLREDGYECLKSSPYKESHLGWHYNRLSLALEVIRKTAKKMGGDGYNFDEYLSAQFLVLFGLLKFNDYPVHCCIHALGLIARKLRGSKWLP